MDFSEPRFGRLPVIEFKLLSATNRFNDIKWSSAGAIIYACRNAIRFCRNTTRIKNRKVKL